MSDFEYDNRCKKNIANSASKRVRNKRGCALPQDNMTKKQLENKNGPIRTYHLRSPMSVKDFREMPRDIQCEYIRYLRKEFQVSDACIGEMMGCSGANILNFRKHNGIDLNTKNYPSTAQRERWKQFCTGTLDEILAEMEEQTPMKKESPAACEVIPIPVPVPVPTAKPAVNAAIKQFAADITVHNWEELYEVLKKFPVPAEAFNVHIECGKKRDLYDLP